MMKVVDLSPGMAGAFVLARRILISEDPKSDVVNRLVLITFEGAHLGTATNLGRAKLPLCPNFSVFGRIAKTR